MNAPKSVSDIMNNFIKVSYKVINYKHALCNFLKAFSFFVLLLLLPTGHVRGFL